MNNFNGVENLNNDQYTGEIPLDEVINQEVASGVEIAQEMPVEQNIPLYSNAPTGEQKSKDVIRDVDYKVAGEVTLDPDELNSLFQIRRLIPSPRRSASWNRALLASSQLNHN